MKPKNNDWKRIRHIPVVIKERNVVYEVYEDRDGKKVGEEYIYNMQEFETKEALLEYLEEQK